MKTLKQLERLRKIHERIKLRNTGTPGELANHLRISERQLYNDIELLKNLDAPVCYDRKIHTYYYTTKFELLLKVSLQVLINDETRTIYAGATFLQKNFFTARFLQ